MYAFCMTVRKFCLTLFSNFAFYGNSIFSCPITSHYLVKGVACVSYKRHSFCPNRRCLFKKWIEQHSFNIWFYSEFDLHENRIVRKISQTFLKIIILVMLQTKNASNISRRLKKALTQIFLDRTLKHKNSVREWRFYSKACKLHGLLELITERKITRHLHKHIRTLHNTPFCKCRY